MGATCQLPFWLPTSPPFLTRDGVPGPVAFIKQKKFVLRVTGTTTEPSYLMPYSDPEKDLDVSHQVDLIGMIEGGITQVRGGGQAGCIGGASPHAGMGCGRPACGVGS